MCKGRTTVKKVFRLLIQRKTMIIIRKKYTELNKEKVMAKSLLVEIICNIKLLLFAFGNVLDVVGC